MQRKTKPELEVLDPSIEALLASARITQPLPQATRARALARARALIAAGAGSPRGFDVDARYPVLRLVLAVCIVLAAGAVGAVVGAAFALRDQVSNAFEPAPALGSEPRASSVASAVSSRRVR